MYANDPEGPSKERRGVGGCTGIPASACVVLKPGQALSADDLIAYCRRSLANYQIPRRVEFSDTELPKSGSGKILKRILRERF